MPTSAGCRSTARTAASARAFDLLLPPVERRDRTVTRNGLLEAVWPGVVVEESNLQVPIGSLRKVRGPTFIATIPGRGDRFTGVLDDAAEGEGMASRFTTGSEPGSYASTMRTP